MPVAVTNLNTYISHVRRHASGGDGEPGRTPGAYWAAGRMTEGPLLTELLTPNSTARGLL